MGRKKSPGLRRRGQFWHIDKWIGGQKIQCSTGTCRLEEAELILAKLIEDHRQASIFGVRPNRTFEEAAAKFVMENTHKASLHDDAQRLANLLPHIGNLPLKFVNMLALGPWMKQRQQDGVSVGTINHGLQVVRRLLNLAATEWYDEYGLTWLDRPAKITLLPDKHKREPYPLTWAEQDRLFSELPEHLRAMALFKVNTGLRDSDVCGLQWDDEVPLPSLHTSVFVIPANDVKDPDGKRTYDRIVVLNSIATAIIEEQRGQHATHVFHYEGQPLTRMGNTAWYKARKRAGLHRVRVHDLKHTFGSRLRAASVGHEDRQELLGHRKSSVTTDYSAAQISHLIEMAERVVPRVGESETVFVLRSRRRDRRQNGDSTSLPS